MFDFHIHTKYSSCSAKHGPYDLIQAFNVVKAHGFEGMGVSDHCNYVGYTKPATFLEEQRQLIDSHNLKDSLLLGLEISIINKKGDLGINPEYLKKVDYYIISEHCHLNRLFSDFYHLDRKFVKWVQEGNEPKIKKTVDFLTELMINGINNNPYSILAHIWRFTRGRSFYSQSTIEKTEMILDALQNKNVAMELHASILGTLLLSNEENDDAFNKIKKTVSPSLHDQLLSPRVYMEEIMKIAKKHDLYYSIGSDAHQLKNIGQFGPISTASRLKELLNKIGIKESKIITPAFFRDKN
jgi:histidinol phosphatase-like PHP family hydrolase